MEIVQSIRPVLAVLVALAAGFLVLALHRKPNARDTVSTIAAIIQFSIVISMAPIILNGGMVECKLFNVLPGIDFSLRVDALGMVFATISSFLWILASIYSVGYMRGANEKKQTRFFACFAISLAAAVGGAFSANIFTLVIFYELLSFITYPLVYHKETPESWEGAKKYIVYLVGTSKTALLIAIILTYYFIGNLDFAKEGMLAGVNASPLLLTFVYICYLVGFAKGGIMPLHIWLPAAMVAPTPVSGLLHAVAVVKMGVFCVLRVIFHVFGPYLTHTLGLDIATAYVVSFTIIVASIYALTQDNLKIRLAYSTVSQLSYIILGAALLTPSSMMGGIMHIASHAFSKITLFYCAGAIYVASHRTLISQLSGIGWKMPWTMTAFFIASLSMIGVPPVGGFVSKWYIALGSIEAKEIPILVVLLVSAVLNAAYFLPISYKAFFEKEEDNHHHSGHGHGGHDEHHEEARDIPMMAVPVVITAILSVLVGIYPDYFLSLAAEVVK